MTRAVLADHILFDECINIFRAENVNFRNYIELEKINHCIILSPFIITKTWDFENCIIYPTEIINLPGPHKTFMSKVKINQKIDSHDTPLFAHALCSILSFLSLSPFKSPRNRYYYRSINNLSNEDLETIALTNPILVAGPGTSKYQLSPQEEDFAYKQAKVFMNKIYSVEYKKYILTMQCIRMIQLSLFNKREDFGLAYQLVISSIEAIAQKAIKRDKVKVKHPKESQWFEISKGNAEFAELYTAYKENRGLNDYLKERYVKFILEYSPISEWESYVENPMQEFLDNIDYDYYVKLGISINKKQHERFFSGNFPTDLSDEIIKDILEKSYVHRSIFVHQGKQPPHKDPNSLNRFFQTFSQYKDDSYEEILLPNYELISSIAKHSILKWLDKK